MTNKTRFKLFQCDHMIHTPYLPLLSQNTLHLQLFLYIACAEFIFHFSRLYKYYTFNIHLSWHIHLGADFNKKKYFRRLKKTRFSFTSKTGKFFILFNS